MIKEQVVIFRIQEEEYAIPMTSIEGTIRHLEIKKVPFAPNCMEGTVNVQGQIVPVIRLSAKFGLLGDGPEKRQLLIADIESHKIGIIVDEIAEVVNLEVGRIEASSRGCSYMSSCITGFGKLGKRLIVLLDIARLFSSDELTSFKMAGVSS